MCNYFTLIHTHALDKKMAACGFPFMQHLFWDTPIENISIANNKRYIVERVLTRGFLEDIYMLLKLYSTDEIKEALRKSKEQDPKTINFCSHYFNLPKLEKHVSKWLDYHNANDH